MQRASWAYCALARSSPLLRAASISSSHTRLTKRFFSETTPRARDYEDFFHYKRTRFVQNEAEQVASRYIRFNVDELAKIAAASVGATSCVNIEKFADGMYNKAILFTMDNGTQMVGKVPNPNAGLPHFTTASEVATMDLMRNVLEIPLPKVYTWCSDAKRSPIGAEYIIMEKTADVPLKSVWSKLELRERFAIVEQIAGFQSMWCFVEYRGYGCVYYASDLAEKQRLPLGAFQRTSVRDNRFAVGPTTGRDWVDNERQTIDFDRGPWMTLEDYLRAIGHRETACIKQFPRLPHAQVTLCGPGTYHPTRQKKLRALDFYL